MRCKIGSIGVWDKPLQGKPLQGFRGQRGRAPLCGVVGQSPTCLVVLVGIGILDLLRG
jgi:hypothetical protein